MPTADCWVPRGQAGNVCTAADQGPLGETSVRHCHDPYQGWTYVEKNPPSMLRDRGFPNELNMTPNSTIWLEPQ